jgi:pilus assembly protein FimV
MDLDLEEEILPAETQDQELELSEDLSLDMDLDLEEEILPAETQDQELGLSEDLSLDMDLDLEEEILPTETQDQELELSLDDGDVLAVDEAPTPASAVGPTGAADDLLTAAETQDDGFDLTDLDDLLEDSESQPQVPDAEELIELSLDEGQESEAETEPAFDLGNEDAASTSAGVPEPGDDDLDLSGFDEMLAADHEPEKPEPEELELSLDDGAEFDLAGEPDLELDDETDKAAVAPAGDIHDDGLDLGGLDSLLDEESEQDDESEPEDLELSLDDDSDQMPLEEPVIEMAEQENADGDLGAIEDLEFELDAEFEDKPVSKATTNDQTEDTTEADEELDLSDIEKMLEDDTLASETSSQVGDLEVAGGAEKWIDDAADDLGLTAEGELDLTDIEAAIDNTDDSVDAGIDDDQELELDLEPFEGLPEEQGDELDLKLEMEEDSSSAVK